MQVACRGFLHHSFEGLLEGKYVSESSATVLQVRCHCGLLWLTFRPDTVTAHYACVLRKSRTPPLGAVRSCTCISCVHTVLATRIAARCCFPICPPLYTLTDSRSHSRRRAPPIGCWRAQSFFVANFSMKMALARLKDAF